MKACVCALAVLLGSASAAPSSPNIVFVLTDDQDQELGAGFPVSADVTPLPKTKALLSDQGATFLNAFVHTPICSPSRAEFLTGRMFHNIKQLGNPGGIYSMHVDEDAVHNNTIARRLSDHGGYTTGLFGKYLNIMPGYVPEGFDAWLANGGGDYVAPQFAVAGVPGFEDGDWEGTVDDYSTAVIGNATVAWIRQVVAEDSERPFFAYVAPKAAHEPFMPATWYANHWDEAWPAQEPRGDNWNCSAEDRADHPEPISSQPMLSDDAAAVITDIFKNRWRTLMSVDDVVAGVVETCEELGVKDNTYFIFSSDHGFTLGQFNMIMDKRHVYDWDTRVPLLISGPGIVAGSLVEFPATQVDLSRTILDLAGVSDSAGDFPDMDGKSYAPLLVDAEARAVPASTRRAVSLRAPDRAAYTAAWRDVVFFEYYYVDDNVKCVGNCTDPGSYPEEEACCAGLDTIPNTECWSSLQGCDTDCYPTESLQNNFIALRRMDGTLYAEYQYGYQSNYSIDFTNADFFEYYDVANDAWQMNNVYETKKAEAPGTISDLHDQLRTWFECAGDSCP